MSRCAKTTKPESLLDRTINLGKTARGMPELFDGGLKDLIVIVSSSILQCLISQVYSESGFVMCGTSGYFKDLVQEAYRLRRTSFSKISHSWRKFETHLL